MMQRLGLIGLALAAMLLVPMAASAKSHNDSIAGLRTFKSYLCDAPVYIYEPRTFACTTITLPRKSIPGRKAKVTFVFRVKPNVTLRNVPLCFSQIGSGKCAYYHFFKVIKGGKYGWSRTRVRYLLVPNYAKSEDALIDNLTVYKDPKHSRKDYYWEANAFTLVVVAV